jgi:N-acetylglutamate synthase-like GNAT family acetyltransferase
MYKSNLIVRVPIQELLENNKELLNKYFTEGHNLVTSYNINKEAYYNMEKANLLDTLVIINEAKVAGFIVATTTINPNYGDLQSTIMAIFVDKPNRKYGTAKELISRMESIVKAKGSKLLTISSPLNSHFNTYLSTLGYKHINNIYGKVL